MLTTYKARLHGSRIHWIDEQPGTVAADKDIEVLITILSERSPSAETIENRGERMAQCLENIARTGGVKGIEDPVAWQRELRRDRQLIQENHANVD